MSANKGLCLIVAHDAGGAEILVNYVQQQDLDCLFLLAGPAIKIFQRKIDNLELCTLEQGLESVQWVLCATSWQSDLEWQVIKQAKLKNIPVISFLDHWVNYQQRFIRQDEEQLPNELWVGDHYAKNMAKKCFPSIPIKQIENPYLQAIKKEIKTLQLDTQVKVPKRVLLFVSENISEHALHLYGRANYFGYTEFDAFEFLMAHLTDVNQHPIEKIVIRPHPSDSLGKYDLYEKQYSGLVFVSHSKTLLEDIVAADIVAGCESMALVVALTAAKKVISCIPVNQPCRLPHREIASLKNILDKKY